MMMKFVALLAALATIATSTHAASLRRRRTLEVEDKHNNRHSAVFDHNDEFERILEESSRLLQESMSMPLETPTFPPTFPPTSPPTLDDRGSAVETKCSQSKAERSRDILSILTPLVESPDLLLIGNTLQFQARLWVDEEDPALICASDANQIAQRFRAALLYFALGGDSWTTADNWLSAEPACDWFGLECVDGAISTIRLDENGLAGEFPSEVFGLPSLERLVLEGNSISGPIPEGIAQATLLQTLDLDFNSLTGELPASLYTLPSITNIDLNNNNLSGSISQSVSDLTTLNVLNLEDNNLTGEIPILSLLQLEELAAFSIQNNEVTGTLEPICNALDDRRQSFPNYAGFLFADCGGTSPPVECSCCTCLA